MLKQVCPTATNVVDAGNAPTSGSVMIDGVASTAALAGTQPRKISASNKTGLSIVLCDGTGSNLTVAHGLNERSRNGLLKSITMELIISLFNIKMHRLVVPRLHT